MRKLVVGALDWIAMKCPWRPQPALRESASAWRPTCSLLNDDPAACPPSGRYR